MDSRIPPVKRPPLKWYCFLVYFLLFASAILNFVSAVIFFVAVARVELHLIQILNLIMGFVAIGLGCYALKTRSSLYWNKKVGPARICLLYLLSAIFDLAYYVIFYWIITDYYWMFILNWN